MNMELFVYNWQTRWLQENTIFLRLIFKSSRIDAILKITRTAAIVRLTSSQHTSLRHTRKKTNSLSRNSSAAPSIVCSLYFYFAQNNGAKLGWKNPRNGAPTPPDISVCTRRGVYFARFGIFLGVRAVIFLDFRFSKQLEGPRVFWPSIFRGSSRADDARVYFDANERSFVGVYRFAARYFSIRVCSEGVTRQSARGKPGILKWYRGKVSVFVNWSLMRYSN